MPTKQGENDERRNDPAQARGTSGLQPVRDGDWLGFELSTTTRVVVETDDGGTAEDHDTVLRLTDASGVEIASDDDRAPGDPYSWVSATLGAGRYFVQVTESGDVAVIPTYTLTVSTAP